LYPEHWKHRRNFFEQLRDTLNACAQLRVLFSMREDYIASIDPYAKILPESLRVRFHLENLRQDSALKAVTGPLTLGYGRQFAPGVAEKLVENLMTVELETAMGATESIISEFVEPLQLQVVCQRLWRDLGPEETEITSKHLETSANIEKALLSFYEESITTVAQRTGVGESALRTWFQNELVTPAGTRGMVFRGHEERAVFLTPRWTNSSAYTLFKRSFGAAADGMNLRTIVLSTRSRSRTRSGWQRELAQRRSADGCSKELTNGSAPDAVKRRCSMKDC
jgi:hypothetical protein